MIDLSHIRAVALDFDGTLIEPGHVICDDAREALRRAAAGGIKIATASGRPVENQQMILEQNSLGPAAGLPHALSCDERTIWLLEDGHYVPLAEWNGRVEAGWERLMPLALRLIESAREELCSRGVAVERHVLGDDVRRRGIVDLRFETEAECTAHGPWLAERVAAISDELRVTWNWHLLQIILRSAGKGNTLAALARSWGMAPREILAVGDRNNDVSMLDGSAGLTPAAVGNAVPEIKALVKAGGGYVARGELGAGVAEIVGAVIGARRRGG